MRLDARLLAPLIIVGCEVFEMGSPDPSDPGDTTENTTRPTVPTTPPEGSSVLSLEDDATAILDGSDPADWAGFSVSLQGDFDGDGLADLLVAAPRALDDRGQVYGFISPVSGTLDLTSADFVLTGSVDDNRAGWGIATDDFDGDSVDDIVVGGVTGAIQVVHGPIPATMDLANADVSFTGGQGVGASLAAVGDVTGDDQVDLLVGRTTFEAFRAAFVVPGPLTTSGVLTDLGFVFIREQRTDQGGIAVSSAGDVDGDGTGDVLIGASVNEIDDAITGATFLVRGPITEDVDLAKADFKMQGYRRGASGQAVAGGGDLDGDGLDDLVVVHPGDETYVVYGDPALSGVMSLADADTIVTSESVRIVSRGDLNGDGLADLVMGADINDDPKTNQALYVFYGPVTGELDQDDADVKLVGPERDNFQAWTNIDVGDVDGDGRDDLLIGNSEVGRIYLVLGRDLP